MLFRSVACQFHPEFKSRPGKPSPLFLGLLLAASGQLSQYVHGYVEESRSRGGSGADVAPAGMPGSPMM